MIYVTGDLHGDLSRFKSRPFRQLRRKDTLIVLGDFGFLWNDTKEEEKMIKWIGRRKYQVLFLDGAHDNLHLIHKRPMTDWCGGRVREISGRLKYLCPGGVFHIEEKTIFAFGGGEPGTFEREDKDWWEELLPTGKDLELARKELDKVAYQVDYIVSYQPSHQIKRLFGGATPEANVRDIFLNEVRERGHFKGWYFGHYHVDKIIPPNHQAVFQEVIPLTLEFNLSAGNFSKKGRRNFKRS